jgi:CRISPR/Cas system-associated exonuclease Cas4 (RecB family)
VPRAADESGPRRVITASEIGEYEYCSRAWWYRHVVKMPAPAGEGQSRLAEGTRAHQRHGERVRRSAQLRTVGLLLALAGVAVIFLALALGAFR